MAQCWRKSPFGWLALLLVCLAGAAGAPACGQDQAAINGDKTEAGPKESGSDLENLKNVIAALFRAYEEENAIAFLEHVHNDYISLDRPNNRQDFSLLRRSLQDDFKILDNIQHKVFVKNICLQKDGKLAQIEIRWQRRVLLTKTGDEWVIREQETVLRFAKNSHWKLQLVYGKPLFGLSDLSGNITIAEGTLNNNPVTQALEIGVVREKSVKSGV